MKYLKEKLEIEAKESGNSPQEITDEILNYK
jgi:hypothetical protein